MRNKLKSTTAQTCVAPRELKPIRSRALHGRSGPEREEESPLPKEDEPRKELLPSAALLPADASDHRCPCLRMAGPRGQVPTKDFSKSSPHWEVGASVVQIGRRRRLLESAAGTLVGGQAITK